MGSFPPAGIFEGRYHDTGSFHGCVDLSLEGLNENLKYTSYCTLSFRPVVVSRPRFHNIYLQQPPQLLNTFEMSDVVRKLAEKAQYYHYVYIKTGACVPYQCSASDVQLIANQMARRLSITAGPVKCFTKAPISSSPVKDLEFGKIESEPVEVHLKSPANSKQAAAVLVLALCTLPIIVATLWHLATVIICVFCPNRDTKPDEKKNTHDSGMNFIKRIAINNLSMLTSGKELITVKLRSDEIECLHVVRVITMLWIIMVHTFQFNDWSSYNRAYETEPLFRNPMVHLIINGNYTVDTFFLLSGLLLTYTQCSTRSGKFSFIRSLLSRYLRLTPQVFIVSMMYIALPLLGGGIFWYDVTHDASGYCEKNWWINLLHAQAFYRRSEICNLVGWWVSADMFLHTLALFIVFFILHGKLKQAVASTFMMIFLSTTIMIHWHYIDGLPPTNLPAVPVVGEAWTEYASGYAWSPWPHMVPFMLGLWLGYSMAHRKYVKLVESHSLGGSIFFILMFIFSSLASFPYSAAILEFPTVNQPQSVVTALNILSPIFWSMSHAWLIISCHYGRALWLNRISSSCIVVFLSRVSFITYLSHMLVLRTYFGQQDTTSSVSTINLGYQVLGNWCLSLILAIFLHVSFEVPLLKFQRYALSCLYSANDEKNPKPRKKDSGLINMIDINERI